MRLSRLHKLLPSRQPVSHFVIQNEGLTQALVHPWFDLSSCGRPPKRVGDLRFDLAHARYSYLRMALFHGYLELAAAAFLFVEGFHQKKTT